jgi:hypothetical protein
MPLQGKAILLNEEPACHLVGAIAGTSKKENKQGDGTQARVGLSLATTETHPQHEIWDCSLKRKTGGEDTTELVGRTCRV